jgi:2-(1,2-epoxy-1,2-dihydrophenyl)acetyl-CoA isomerase
MPVVAAVNGATVGGGNAVAMAADVRVAGRSATFTTGYSAVGASPDGGASFHLARALGGPQALSSLLLNRRFSSDELLRLGLVDELVEDDQLDGAALALAVRAGQVPVGALQAARSLVQSAFEHSFDDHLDAERELFLRVAVTQGFRSGVTGFVAQAK